LRKISLKGRKGGKKHRISDKTINILIESKGEVKNIKLMGFGIPA